LGFAFAFALAVALGAALIFATAFAFGVALAFAFGLGDDAEGALWELDSLDAEVEAEELISAAFLLDEDANSGQAPFAIAYFVVYSWHLLL